MRCIRWFVISLLFGALLPVAPAKGHLPTTDANLAAAMIEQRPGAAIPLDQPFRDEHGRLRTLRDAMAGRVTLLAFTDYDCPQLCHHLLDGLVAGLRPVSLQPAHDFTVVVVSIDPTAGPAEARALKTASLAGESPERAAGWVFLTSTEASIRSLTHAVGFGYAYDAAQQAYAHGAGIVVLTPAGRVSRYLLGIEFAPQDLRLGLLDAAGGGIGSFTDHIVLRCYRYDPVHGRYSLAIMGLLRTVGALTVGAVGLLLWRLNRQTRRRQP